MLSAARSSRAKVLQPRPPGSPALSTSTALQLTCRLQTRQFCFGAWSVSSGSASHHDGRRRHRARYQYMESLNRNLSWDKDANKTIKKAMAAFAQAPKRHNKKYVNVDEVKSWSDEFSGVRPGKNIEDVERGAIDHLIRGDKPLNYGYDMWKSHLNNIRSYLESQRGSKPIPKDANAADAETFIDPITNRRVSKSSPSLMYNDLDGYRSTEFSSEPINSAPKYDDLDRYGPTEGSSNPQRKTPYKDLDQYGSVLWNEPDGVKGTEASQRYEDLDKYTKNDSPDTREAAQQSGSYHDLDKYKPVEWNEPDGQQEKTSEELSKKYKDLDQYHAVRWNEPDGLQGKTKEELSRDYDDLHKYGAVQWNEPDGLRKETKEELSKNYDDLHKYGAVHWNEPDGLRKPTPEELSKDYNDLNGYGPVTWSEPDGLRRLTPEEQSKDYKDLDGYNAPFVAKISTLQAHAAAQMDSTVRGEPLAAKVNTPPVDPASEYKDLDEYGPVHWNEPDGLRELTPEELSKKYDDLHLYGEVRWNEPDGLRKLTPEEESKKYPDVPLYAPRDLEPETARIHPEQASKVYKDLPAYRHYDNTSSTRIHPEEASKKYQDLGKYAAYENDGPSRVHPEQASKQYTDLFKYSASIEAEGQTSQLESTNYPDLDKYSQSVFDSVDTPYPVHPEEATKVYKDLDRYSAIHYNEPDGKSASKPDAVAQGLEEFDSKAGPQDTRSGPSVTYPHRRTNSDCEVDSLTAEDIRATTMRRAEQDQSDSLPIQLTGNYVRDFPEEFATSWAEKSSTLVPKDQLQADQADQDGAEVSSMDESFPIEDKKIQPAIDRYWAKIDEAKDPYSHIPQGLETSFADECGRDTLPTMEKHYTKPDDVSMYKILAFDASSQTMSIADATTTMENDSPSTLSDILLRLTSPSKFLPHFESLQAQGYEVASGSGDVLIFRKVRKGDVRPAFPPRVNPIDMMGKPAIGNFASPTGFVNYDAPETMPKPAPPFRPVNEPQPEHAPIKGRKKRRLGRKLVLGTAGLAGSAYAAAVMGEYYSTKGVREEAKRGVSKG